MSHQKNDRFRPEEYRGREGKSPLCAAAIIIRDGKVLMGAREYVKGNPMWTLPGGRCEFGEDLRAALHREIKEEIGVTDLKIIRFLKFRQGVFLKGKPDADIVYIYECHTDQEPKMMEPDKFTEWKWFSPGEMPEGMLVEGDIELIRMVI